MHISNNTKYMNTTDQIPPLWDKQCPKPPLFYLVLLVIVITNNISIPNTPEHVYPVRVLGPVHLSHVPLSRFYILGGGSMILPKHCLTCQSFSLFFPQALLRVEFKPQTDYETGCSHRECLSAVTAKVDSRYFRHFWVLTPFTDHYGEEIKCKDSVAAKLFDLHCLTCVSLTSKSV